MSDTVAVFVWLTATLAHFVLSARFQRRRLQPLPIFDEQAFASLTLGIGSLSVVLHVVAMTVGLSLAAGLAGLTVWHLGLWLIGRSTAPATTSDHLSPVRGLAEGLSLLIVTAILFTWVDVASQSAAVSGTDAAHYHVPVAVNLSLGAGLFGLPATSHPYPMAASLLHAWFIVPLGDPLLLDLAMCLPFVLAIAALNWIFRVCTGQSGLAWASWISVLLFSTPLFRSSSLVSADLWFAAAFIALTAVLLSIWARQTSPLRAIVLGSLSVGLLVGTKSMGSLAAVLLIGTFALMEIARHVIARNRPHWSMTQMLAAGAIAAALILGAGGVWLVRNWDQFGSPVAPAGVSLFGIEIFPGERFEPTTHLSIYGDLQKDPNYDLAGRTSHYIRSWIGSWFLPALGLILLVPFDLVVAWVRRREFPGITARAFVWLMTAGTGTVMVMLLVGAPWTSLEWTDGFSLRYVLPVIALVPIVAVIALLPLSWRWYTSIERGALLQGVLIAMSLSAFHAALDPATPRPIHVPTLSLGWLAAAGIVLAIQWMSRSRGRRLQALVVLVIGLTLAGTWSRMIGRRAAEVRSAVATVEIRERSRLARLVGTGSNARDAYFLTLADEDAAGRHCEYRRFFVMTRFDEPLMMQSARYTNQVFHASREVARTRRAGPLGPCGYVITNRAVMQTDKGKALVDGLADGSPIVEVGEAGSFVVLRRQ